MKAMKKGLAGIVLMLALFMLVPVTAKADGAAPGCPGFEPLKAH